MAMSGSKHFRAPKYGEQAVVALVEASFLGRQLISVFLKRVVRLAACGPGEARASCRMPAHPIVEAADCAGEPLLLTIGRAGVLSCRAIAAGELETLLSLLGPLSERQRSDLKRATDIVLIENGAVIYWPRTGEQFHTQDAAYAIARVQAILA
jgi:hypothetical protein